MSTWHFYRLADGFLTGRSMTGPAADVAANAPADEGVVAGVTDWRSERVRLVTDDQGNQVPTLVDWQPPAPPDDAMQTWSWDAAAKRWISAPTLAARALEAKAERMTRLERCDWVAARAFETGQPVPPAWLNYRQALRDITEQPGFPDAITWPIPPTN